MLKHNHCESDKSIISDGVGDQKANQMRQAKNAIEYETYYYLKHCFLLRFCLKHIFLESC